MQLPTIIADNGGYDSADLTAKLRASHTDGKATHGLGEMTFSLCHLMLTLCMNMFYLIVMQCLQCFDTVGWAAGRASGL